MAKGRRRSRSEAKVAPDGHVWMGEPLREEVGIVFYHAVRCEITNLGEVVIHVGDYVYLRGKRNQRYIAKVEALYENTTVGQKWLQLVWYYTRDEVPPQILERMTLISPSDIFCSEDRDTTILNSITGMCDIFHATWSDPVPTLSSDSYICRYRYDVKPGATTRSLVRLKRGDATEANLQSYDFADAYFERRDENHADHAIAYSDKLPPIAHLDESQVSDDFFRRSSAALTSTLLNNLQSGFENMKLFYGNAAYDYEHLWYELLINEQKYFIQCAIMQHDHSYAIAVRTAIDDSLLPPLKRKRDDEEASYITATTQPPAAPSISDEPSHKYLATRSLSFDETHKRTSARVGAAYQAVVPAFNPPTGTTTRSNADLVWCPAKGESVYSQYMLLARQVIARHINDRLAVRSGSDDSDDGPMIDGTYFMVMTSVEDFLLELLHKCSYDCTSAISELEDNVGKVIIDWTHDEQHRLSYSHARHLENLARLVTCIHDTRKRASVIDYTFRYLYSAAELEQVELPSAEDSERTMTMVTRNSSSELLTRSKRSEISADAADNLMRQGGLKFLRNAREALGETWFALLMNALLLYDNGVLSPSELVIRVRNIFETGVRFCDIDEIPRPALTFGKIFKEFMDFLPFEINQWFKMC